MRNWVYNNQNKFKYVFFASSFYLYSVVRASSLYSVIFSVESPFQFSISLFFLYICISVFCFFVINFWENLWNWTTEIGHTSSVNFLHLWYCILLLYYDFHLILFHDGLYCEYKYNSTVRGNFRIKYCNMNKYSKYSKYSKYWNIAIFKFWNINSNTLIFKC